MGAGDPREQKCTGEHSSEAETRTQVITHRAWAPRLSPGDATLGVPAEGPRRQAGHPSGQNEGRKAHACPSLCCDFNKLRRHLRHPKERHRLLKAWIESALSSNKVFFQLRCVRWFSLGHNAIGYRTVRTGFLRTGKPEHPSDPLHWDTRCTAAAWHRIRTVPKGWPSQGPERQNGRRLPPPRDASMEASGPSLVPPWALMNLGHSCFPHCGKLSLLCASVFFSSKRMEETFRKVLLSPVGGDASNFPVAIRATCTQKGVEAAASVRGCNRRGYTAGGAHGVGPDGGLAECCSGPTPCPGQGGPSCSGRRVSGKVTLVT